MDSGTAGLIGVVVGATITSIREFLVHRGNRRRNAIYLASRVSSMLERFVVDCARASCDTGEPDPEGNYYPRYATPQFDPTTLDVDWKTLPAGLMYSILDLPYRIEVAEGSIEAASENDGFYEERRFQFATLGLEASVLVVRLLSHAGLPERPTQKWDPVDTMRRELSEIVEARRLGEVRHAEWMKTAPSVPSTIQPPNPAAALAGSASALRD